ncbi:MAG: PDZ domain-containing protein, partial [Pirellulaceae bacterium]|nr:PDZ domain-containing protein [Pirellulaceae bacterium]
QTGDRITRINDHEIHDHNDVVAVVGMSRAGDAIQIAIERDSDTLVRTLTLKKHPQQRIAMTGMPNPDAPDGAAPIWRLQPGQRLQTLPGQGNRRVPMELLPRVPIPLDGQQPDQNRIEEVLRMLEKERELQNKRIQELNDRILEMEAK